MRFSPIFELLLNVTWALSFYLESVLESSTTCIRAVTKWLKSSVQIQISNLFVFVWREPFLSGTARSISETQSEELFICLGCSPALLCSCPGLQPSFASPHCSVMDRWRPLMAASMHVSRALSCGGPNIYSVMPNPSALQMQESVCSYFTAGF